MSPCIFLTGCVTLLKEDMPEYWKISWSAWKKAECESLLCSDSGSTVGVNWEDRPHWLPTQLATADSSAAQCNSCDWPTVSTKGSADIALCGEVTGISAPASRSPCLWRCKSIVNLFAVWT